MTYTRAALVSLLSRMFSVGLGAVTAIVLARWLGPADRGLYGVVTSLAALLALFANLGLGDAQTHFVGRDRSRLPRSTANAVLFSAAAGLVAAVVLVVARGSLVVGLPALSDDRVFAIVVLSVPALILYSFEHPLLQTVRAFGLSAVLLGASYVPMLVAMWVLVDRMRLGLLGALVAWAFNNALFVAVGLVALARIGRGIGSPDLSALRSEFQLGSVNWVNTATTFFASRVGLLVVGALLPPAEAGQYAVALTLAELLWHAPDAASVALKPLVAGATDTDVIPPTAQVARTVIALTAVLGAALFVLADPIVTWLFGADYKASAAIVRWLVPGAVAFSVWRVLVADLIGRGRPTEALASAIAAAVVAGGLSLALVVPVGALGTAAATTAAYLAATVLLVRSYGRLTGIGARELIMPRPTDVSVLWSRLRA